MAGAHEPDLTAVARARVSRRGFLSFLGVATLAACSGDGGDRDAARSTTSALATTSAPTTARPVEISLPADPFTLGVTSGAPLPDGIVLWTRLAPDPFEPGGGMRAGDVPVRWEIATDDAVTNVVQSGDAVAGADFGHSVHVDVRGLDPGREYWYRFRVGDYDSPVGRARTAPARGVASGRLVIGQASCQRYASAFYTAYDDLVAHDVDLVVHCGDYIYESPGSGVRDEPLPEGVDLDSYRARYALYRGDPAIQRAHALAPWIVTWDDHEVDNNYVGDRPEPSSVTPGRDEFLARRAAAYQAWWEHMPVRLDPPSGPTYAIHRSSSWGDLVEIFAIDSRQYRTPHPCTDGFVGPRCAESYEPGYTMLGPAQERWLDEALRSTGATWAGIAGGVIVQQWRFAPGDAPFNLDQWDGYPAARDRFLASLDASPAQPVVLTGDVHSSWVGSLALDFDDPGSAVVGTEFVVPGISSRPEAAITAVSGPILDHGPHIEWAETTRRGWVLHEIDRQEWRATYRLVDDAEVEGSAVRTASEWVVEQGGTVASA